MTSQRLVTVASVLLTLLMLQPWHHNLNPILGYCAVLLWCTEISICCCHQALTAAQFRAARIAENKKANNIFLAAHFSMHSAMLRPPTVKNTGTHAQLFFSEDELEKSMARRHWMSLNMWVKLMDCFLPLCPWPLLLPRSSHIQCNLSLTLHPRITLPRSCRLGSNISVYFLPPSPHPLVSEPQDTVAQQAGSIWQQHRSQHTHAHVGDRQAFWPRSLL